MLDSYSSSYKLILCLSFSFCLYNSAFYTSSFFLFSWCNFQSLKSNSLIATLYGFDYTIVSNIIISSDGQSFFSLSELIFVGTYSILSKASNPLTNFPKTVCLKSKWLSALNVIKN